MFDGTVVGGAGSAAVIDKAGNKRHFTGDGFVNGFDIQAILSANLFGKAKTFLVVGLLAGIGGIMAASRLRSVSTAAGGGNSLLIPFIEMVGTSPIRSEIGFVDSKEASRNDYSE